MGANGRWLSDLAGTKRDFTVDGVLTTDEIEFSSNAGNEIQSSYDAGTGLATLTIKAYSPEWDQLAQLTLSVGSSGTTLALDGVEVGSGGGGDDSTLAWMGL